MTCDCDQCNACYAEAWERTHEQYETKIVDLPQYEFRLSYNPWASNRWPWPPGPFDYPCDRSKT